MIIVHFLLTGRISD